MSDQTQPDSANPSHDLFDSFTSALTCKEVQQTFSQLCQHLELDPLDYRHFYSKLKDKLNYWKAKELWKNLDKRAAHPDYLQSQACAKNKCLVLGAGPCGLRTAIELALLGAQVVLVEKRDSFSRNNVLHLWPYTIRDLRALGAKKFYGKFCTGSLDHISIRQLQLILLKVVLLLGVEVHTGVSFKGLVEPSGSKGWRAAVSPPSHPVANYEFDVFISAGGGRYVPDGFKRKELRGKLAIGITANFLNRHTAAEAQVAEISGVARIYNQKFFQELHSEMGIDLENIVYYKDDTHYFVMTAKKKSLLKKGVIKEDLSDAEELLAVSNVDKEALLQYAYDAADFSTGQRLPELEFAQNHAGEPDVAMFDFTCMHRAENASLLRERRGKKLLIGLVGDCLVEPFWPLGTGIARGFLAAFDTAWMVRSWGQGKPHLQVLAERESLYQLLSQTTPENTSKNYTTYSIDPSTRYPTVNMSSIKPNQVQHLCDVEDHPDTSRPSKKRPVSKLFQRNESLGRYKELLGWCQKHTSGYKGVKVKNLDQSWRSGLALCALIHRFRPSLIDMSSLDESNPIYNNQMAFDLLQKELGIVPILSASAVASSTQIDTLSMVLYLTQVRDAFSERSPPADQISVLAPSKPLSFSRTRSAVVFLNKLKHNSLQRRKEQIASDKEERELRKRQMKVEEEEEAPKLTVLDVDAGRSEACCFCGGQLYAVERGSAEGKFFHRGCFTCYRCGSTLRQGGYAFHPETGRFYCEMHSEEAELGRGEPAPTAQTEACEDDGRSEKQDGMKVGNGEVNGLPQAQAPPERQGSCQLPVSSDPSDPPSHDAQRPLHPTLGSLKHPTPGTHSTHTHPAPETPQETVDLPPPTLPTPKPAPRSRKAGYTSSPVPKPRTIHPVIPREPSPAPSLEDEDEEDEDEHTLDCPAPRPRPKPTPDPAPCAQEADERNEDEAGEERTPSGHSGVRGQLPMPDPGSQQSLRKLQLTEEERSQLVCLSFSLDSDSETPASSSAASTSSSSKHPDGGEEESYWGGGTAGAYIREKRNRKCLRRRGEAPVAVLTHHGKPRSKFSPWNLSSPRLARDQRLSLLNHRAAATADHCASGDDGAAGDEDEDDDDLLDAENVDSLHEKAVPSDPVEAEKLALLKMRTLERRAKTSELQRFHKAQSIQRRLEEIEVTFKELEEKGVVLERALRGEAGAGGTEMIDQWIELVQQKNAVVSEESDLMVASRQLELEDKQSMLEMELRRYMEIDESVKSAEQRTAEEQALQQMLEVVDMRNSLVAFLEERRLKELSEEELTSSSLLENKRLSTASAAQVHWA